MKKKIGIILSIIIAIMLIGGIAYNVYARYVLSKRVSISFDAADYYFDIEVDKTEMTSLPATINVIVKNYEGDNFTDTDLQYALSTNNDKLDIRVDENEGTLTGGSKQEKSFTVTIEPKEEKSYGWINEILNINFNVKTPYTDNKQVAIKVRTDGEWNGEVNVPKIADTGLIPIYYGTNGKVVELNENSSKEEWNNWYDYDEKRWANAITKDSNGNITGYFVWIPRFAYKITSGLYTNTEGNIEVKFLQGTTNKDNTNKEIDTNYPSVSNNAMNDFVVHPAFTTDVNNGGWDTNISGFWIAKYSAGYQQRTITDNNGSLTEEISNKNDKIVYSNIRYEHYRDTQNINNLNQDITESPLITYPVFKPLTHIYSKISISDAYNISKELTKGTDFYNLSNIDSHLTKNSEWGAVAYLGLSEYGIGKNVNTNNYGNGEILITGIYANGTNNQQTNILNNPYYSSIGVNGSTTGNVYGVYDLAGATWEMTAGFISNGHQNLLLYGESILKNNNVTYNKNAGTVTKNTGQSNKYFTIYPYNAQNDENLNNFTEYSKYKLTRYGDAILETSLDNVNSRNSWYGNASIYMATSLCFTVRGGSYATGTTTGLLAYGRTAGANSGGYGFRVVLTP